MTPTKLGIPFHGATDTLTPEQAAALTTLTGVAPPPGTEAALIYLPAGNTTALAEKIIADEPAIAAALQQHTFWQKLVALLPVVAGFGVVNFTDILRLGGEWANYVADASDTVSRERLISRGHALIQTLAAHDHDALGAIIDRAAESARKSNFFRGA